MRNPYDGRPYDWPPDNATRKEPSEMPSSNPWEMIFNNWPETLARRGVVVNKLGEASPFKGFLIRDGMIVFERSNPDTLGARFILMAYDSIDAVKLVDPLKAEAFAPFGFAGKFSS